jgi:hypothetical protein
LVYRKIVDNERLGIAAGQHSKAEQRRGEFHIHIDQFLNGSKKGSGWDGLGVCRCALAKGCAVRTSTKANDCNSPAPSPARPALRKNAA